MHRVLSLLALLAGIQLWAADYVLTDLGSGSAVDINNSGVVALNDAGHAYRVVNLERQQFRVLIYEAPDLSFRLFADQVTAAAINDAGHVVGKALSSVGGGGAFLDRGDTNIVKPATVLGLNNFDQAAGFALFDPGWVRACTLTFWPLFSLVQVPEQNYGELRDVNDAGVAVGLLAATKSVGSFPEPYRYSAYRARAIKFQGGQVTYLDMRSPGDLPIYHNQDASVRLSEAHAVNLMGDVVGEMALVADGPKHAFRHIGAGMEDLGTLGGETSVALDINDHGVIVGSAKTAAGDERAFLWKQGTMTDLNSLSPAGSGFTLVRALAINNAGQIVGDAQMNGQARAFLLSPFNLGQQPFINQHPLGSTQALGATIALSASATGSLPLSYQWRQGSTVLDGATNNVLVLTNLTAFSQGDYRVVVTNAFGSAISEPATVVVLDPRLTALNFAGLRLEGAVGVTYRIEATPGLGPENWQPVSQLTLTNAVQLWVDLESISKPQQVYRAIRLP